jgi:hypothetical protein
MIKIRSMYIIPVCSKGFTTLIRAMKKLVLGQHRMMDEWEGARSRLSICVFGGDFLSASERWTKWVLGWFPRLSFQF